MTTRGRSNGLPSSARPALITPYRDGPLLVRGPVRIQDQDGNAIVIEREVVALCRCGKSRSRPLCDGTHKLIHFRAPSGFENGVRNSARQNGAGGRDGLEAPTSTYAPAIKPRRAPRDRP
jgi:CDGSH-type Zn-finger protein